VRKIKVPGIVKDSFILSLGTGIAFLISFAFQPMLTRVYSPQEFGVYSLYTSVFGILVAISTFRYESAIVVPGSNLEAKHITVLGIVAAFCFSIVCFLAVLLFYDELLSLLDLETATWLYLIPFSVFIFSAYRVLNMWLVRNELFKLSASNKILKRSTEGGAQLGFNSFISHSGLILGTIVGDLINVLVTLKFVRIKTFFKSIYIGNLKKIAIKYKSYPLNGAFPFWLNSISLLVPIILFNRLFDEGLTGQFGLARMVMTIPMALVSMSLGQVLSKEISKRFRNKEVLYPFVIKIALILTGASSVGVLVFFFFSQPIFHFVYGNGWEVSADIASWLVISFGVMFVVSPLSVLFASINKVQKGSRWYYLHFGLIALLFFVQHDTYIGFIKLYVMIEVVSYLTYFVFILHESLNLDKALRS
jgi:O-antigen/teichoic acid export membrane protein